jgi:hypothetical protein
VGSGLSTPANRSCNFKEDRRAARLLERINRRNMEALMQEPKKKTRANNVARMYEIDGIKASLSYHAERLGVVSRKAALGRLHLGWDAEDAVKTPLYSQRRRDKDDTSGSTTSGSE